MPRPTPPVNRERSALPWAVACFCLLPAACMFWGASDDPLAGAMVLGEPGTDLAASGSVCYLRGASEIRVVDASDAAQPMTAASLPLAEETDNRTAFTAAGDLLLSGVDLYDISDPLSPLRVGTIDLGGAALSSAVLQPPYLYAMAEVLTATEWVFTIVDLSDPAHPALVGTKEVTRNYLWVNGDRVFVYTDCYEELDTSDPASLRTVARYDELAPLAQCVSRGSYTFEPGGKASLLRVWDTSVPEEPVEVATVRIAELVSSYAAYPAGDTLVLLSQSRVVPSLQQIWAVDVSDPTQPGFPRRIDAGISLFSSLIVAEERVYATGMEYIFGSRLLLYVMVLP
jgi:hypothetical protein